MDMKTVLAVTRFEHEWLADSFVQATQTLAASEAARRHHYVPEFYLRRWCVNGELKPVVVDSKATLMNRPGSDGGSGYLISTKACSPCSVA